MTPLTTSNFTCLLSYRDFLHHFKMSLPIERPGKDFNPK